MGTSSDTKATNATNYQIAQDTNAANLQIAQDTNAANLQIAQMTNEYNEAMLDKQIETQWEMWNAENEYNTPAAQRARMTEAGYNPWNTSGSTTTGTASSMTSPAAQAGVSAEMQAAQMQNPYAERIAKTQQIISALTGVRDTISGFGSTMSDYAKGVVDTRSIRDVLKGIRADANIKANDAYWRNTRNNLEAFGMEANALGSIFMAGMRQKDFFNYDTTYQMNICNTVFDIISKAANSELTDAQIRKMIADARISESDARVYEATEEARKLQIEGDAEYRQNNKGSDNAYQLIQGIIFDLAEEFETWEPSSLSWFGRSCLNVAKRLTGLRYGSK